MSTSEGNVIPWFSLLADRHSDPPTVNKCFFTNIYFVLIAVRMRQSSYFIYYQTSFDAVNDNLPNFTKIPNSYHV